ncbi:MAG: DUF4928 domain-containing protein [Methanobacteriota archaeon]|nr:MAG: DUF4928 domain-containing protein [Euryarchaeota archaeon]
MSTIFEEVRKNSLDLLNEWIQSCTRANKVSRNTVSVGIVVLHHLRQNCPVSKSDVVSPGGEIKGARSGLGNILEQYGIPRKYLKEVTTRQGHQDGQRLFALLDYGEKLASLPKKQREQLILEMIDKLASIAKDWLNRQNLKLSIDRRQTPTAWINLIIENAKSRSGGVVEQHLVGAKLAKRFSGLEVPNHPAHAADRQTGRTGDFVIRNLVFHVTANPSRDVVEKCRDNIQKGLHPILLIPKEVDYRAIALAQEEGIDRQISIVSIEDFVAVNIIELATAENTDFYAILQDIINIYNQRLSVVETDMSLQITLR